MSWPGPGHPRSSVSAPKSPTFVVPVSGTRPDADEIVGWARDAMANYKAPRHVRIVDALPTNASGKVLKTALRDTAAADAP